MLPHFIADASTHDRPIDWALAWAAAGWPVAPVWPGTKIRCTSGKPSTDLARVRRWWSRWPQANIGLVLGDTGLMVLDTDGVQREQALTTLLGRAGCTLPDTYEEATGRPDSGRHIYLRLPPNCPPLVGQYGNQPRFGHPGLDVLTAGMVVVAGSIHKTGTAYQNAAGRPPTPDEVLEMPHGLYQALRAVGSVRGTSPSRGPRRKATAALGTTTGLPNSICLPKDLRRLLADTSDGRNSRAFKVVAMLVRRGLPDELIVEILLNSPLGQKAFEKQPHDPAGWVRQKIASVHAQGLAQFDYESYWTAIHTAGLASPVLRLLDFMAAQARYSGGRVSMSFDRLGIGSAMSDPDDHIRTAVDWGFLRVVERPARGSGLPTTYALTLPEQTPGHEPAIPLGEETPPPTPQSLAVYGGFMTSLSGHDACRRSRGSLHQQYPLYALLGHAPTPLAALATWLHTTTDKVETMTLALVRAGLVQGTEEGVSLTPGDARPLLRAVATRAGTDGARTQALRAYKDKCHAWGQRRRAWISERQAVGSPLWLREFERELRETFAAPHGEQLRLLWAEEGHSFDDLVATVLEARLAHESFWSPEAFPVAS